MPKNWPKLLLAIIICEGAGLVGSIFTFSAIPGWYGTINKPNFTPPNSIFGPVWTILYLLMGLSLYFLWQSKDSENKRQALFIFYLQLTLNTIWSLIFFGAKNIQLAFYVIIILWIFILLTIIKSFKVNRESALLIIPYLIWVTFASFLNYTIFVLN